MWFTHRWDLRNKTDEHSNKSLNSILEKYKQTNKQTKGVERVNAKFKSLCSNHKSKVYEIEVACDLLAENNNYHKGLLQLFISYKWHYNH